MNSQTQKPRRATLPVVMAVIPEAFFVFNIVGIILMALAGRTNDHQEAVLVLVGIVSLIGVFVLPFISLIFEIIGLVAASKRRLTALKVILIIELVITVIAGIICAVLFSAILRS